METEHDEWIPAGFIKSTRSKKCSTPLILEQIKEHTLIIEEGGIDHDAMQTFHDWMLISIPHESPEDVEANENSKYSN